MTHQPTATPCVLLVPVAMILAHCASEALGQQIEGFTEPCQTVEVAAAEPGIVTSMEVGEGQRVERNQLLATLDIDVLRAMLAVAEARMRSVGRRAAAQAEWQLTKTRVEKLRTLRLDGHSSQIELERAEADLAVTEAKRLTADEEREIARLECLRIRAQIKRRQIRSPIDGFVIRIARDVGEAVRSVDPTILTVVDLASLRARFSVTHAQAVRFRVGQDVEVTFPATSQKARGTITVIAPVTDAKSGTTEIVIRIDNPQQEYRSGMRCILAEEPSDAK